jgi:hypothetical protein
VGDYLRNEQVKRILVLAASDSNLVWEAGDGGLILRLKRQLQD